MFFICLVKIVASQNDTYYKLIERYMGSSPDRADDPDVGCGRTTP